MTDQERIEEAHGLWEIAVTRLAALSGVVVDAQIFTEALAQEREAFARWTRVSADVTESR